MRDFIVFTCGFACHNNERFPIRFLLPDGGTELLFRQCHMFLHDSFLYQEHLNVTRSKNERSDYSKLVMPSNGPYHCHWASARVREALHSTFWRFVKKCLWENQLVFGQIPQTFLINSSKLKMYLCEIPTVVTETLVVETSQDDHLFIPSLKRTKIHHHGQVLNFSNPIGIAYVHTLPEMI